MMERQQPSAIFKVLFPIICLALVTMMASTARNETRMKVIALALIGGANMLNPDVIGLPPGYDGPMPFLLGDLSHARQRRDSLI